MIEKKDIEHLAKLARIEVTEEEKESLTKDLENILEYVGQIQILDEEIDFLKPEFRGNRLRNVLREDENPHEGGVYTDKILEEAPENKKGFVKVKNIL